MPCPASPDSSGFHRYVLAPQGDDAPTTYEICCVYCGQEKQVRPVDGPHTVWTSNPAAMRSSTAKGNAAGIAAKRQKRAAP